MFVRSDLTWHSRGRNMFSSEKVLQMSYANYQYVQCCPNSFTTEETDMYLFHH